MLVFLALTPQLRAPTSFERRAGLSLAGVPLSPGMKGSSCKTGGVSGKPEGALGLAFEKRKAQNTPSLEL